MKVLKKIKIIIVKICNLIVTIPDRFKQKYLIRKYFKKNHIRKLNIGCGRNMLENWINADITKGRYEIYLDARKKMPFSNDSLDFIFCEHFIEHLEFEEAQSFLSDCYRVLKKGSCLRISTPDLDKIIDIYKGTSSFVSFTDIITRHIKNTKRKYVDHCIFLNDKMRFGGTHKFIFNKKTLVHCLEETGFRNIKECEYEESSYEELKNIDKHADVEWMKFVESLILEAIK